MNIEIVGVAYTPSQDTSRNSTAVKTPAQEHMDEAATVVASNSLKAREQARKEADFSAFAGTIDAHDLNMNRVMELLNDPALSDL